jgi:hypothetical protein
VSPCCLSLVDQVESMKVLDENCAVTRDACLARGLALPAHETTNR